MQTEQTKLGKSGELQRSRQRYIWLAATVVVVCLLCFGRASAQKDRQPVYVGARYCMKCHAGVAGNQFSNWLMSKHANAYAVLWSPQSKDIAEHSGIPVEPSRSPVCLGCHATASDTEKWERDPTFHIEDGIQCEFCHGPGSEYANEKTMHDEEAAIKAGLRFPTKHDCQLCHYVKGSHSVILKQPPLNVDELWKKISHMMVGEGTGGRDPVPIPANAGDAANGAPRYAGNFVCAQCHSGPQMGYQWSRWRLTPHARAYAVLSTPAALQLAQKRGVKGDPQEAPECLKCHSSSKGADQRQVRESGAALETFSLDEGVGCEACHGPGSAHAASAAAPGNGNTKRVELKRLTRDVCAGCHVASDEHPFDYEKAMAAIAHPTELPQTAARPRYKTPVNLAVSPDSKEIYVACEASGSVIVVDAVKRQKVAEIETGGEMADVTFSPDGKRAYASDRLLDTVSVIDTATRRVVSKVHVGGEPHGVLTDRSGKTLYVLNTAGGDISVIDTGSLHEVKRLTASRNPWSLALSPDGTRLIVTNMLSRFVPFRMPPVSEITVIDAARSMVEDRVAVNEANLLLGVAWHPSGEYALVTLNRTKNLVPMTRIQQGWTITNGLGVLWKNGRIDQVLLDEPNLYFSDVTDVAITPDGRYALATSSSSDRVAVIDVAKLIGLLKNASPEAREKVIPNHLGKSLGFVVGYLPTKHSPRGIAVSGDGRTAYAGNALDDSLTVIDLKQMAAADRIDLGGPKELTKARRGEILFNTSRITFQRQFSCHSCHPDGHIDGLTYDIEADGIGVSPVDNRTLRGIVDTDPFKWEGTNPSLARQCGARLSVFFTRLAPFTKEELDAVDTYVTTIARPPNRFRPLGADYTPAQRRGKMIFYRTVANDGRVIPPEGRCYTCHFPPLYTDRSQRDVGTKYALDRQGKFDVPHLNNIHDSAPYLHNGIANTLEEIWTRFNPNDTHGVTNDLTKDQLNDLIEFLKTL